MTDPSTSAEALARPGDVLMGKYRVEGVIGSGGMGVVMAATHLQLKTKVALKLVRPDKDGHGLAVDRLLREAQATARIKSEHAVRVMDVGTLANGAPCIVMEHLEGQDLGAVLRDRGPLPIAEAVGVVLDACEAVAEAHGAGIVHRDIKPSNLFLAQSKGGPPLVKVLDFGIAKATDEGSDADPDGEALTASRAVLGSPVYMSPEQLQCSKNVDRRTDVWSFGVVLHELVTGQVPFQAGSFAGLIAAILHDPPARLRQARPEAPADLESVILACLEKDVARRTATVEDLARALRPFLPTVTTGRIAAEEGVAGASAAAPEPARERPPVARKVPVALIAAALAACALVAAVLAWRSSGPPVVPPEDKPASATTALPPSMTASPQTSAPVGEAPSTEAPSPGSAPPPSATARPVVKPKPTDTAAPTSSVTGSASGKGADVGAATAHRK